MANIMMTDFCNLSCPYCFANEFVGKSKNEITEEVFDQAIKFITKDGNTKSLGLIGGEPLTHSNFEGLVKKVLNNEQIDSLMIYTNGILIDQYPNIATHPKIYYLINCNPPSQIGENNWNKLVENLDFLINQRAFKDHINLGINMFGADFEYRYILDLIKRFDFKKVRVSLTVPNMEENRNTDALKYFKVMKPQMLAFFKELLNNGIVPYFDCNKFPSCLINKEDFEILEQYRMDSDLWSRITQSNILNDVVECAPVIDIRQDLTAVRCFGLSEYTKVDIREFNTIKELVGYYTNKIDALGYHCISSPSCNNCKKRNSMVCSGGCLAFKIKNILDLSTIAQQRRDDYEKSKVSTAI